MEHKGLLLGVRGRGIAGVPTYQEETRRLEPDSTLVFYTDGLTDRRSRSDGTGHYTEAEALQMLCQAVRAAARGSVEDVAAAAEHAVPGDIDDDMAIVVIRTSPDDLASWEGRFLAEPIRVSEARRLAYQTFLRWGMEAGQTDLACLLVSEVVTNVVLHAAATQPRRSEFLRPAIDPEAGPDRCWPTGPAGCSRCSTDDDDHGPGGGKEFTLRLRRGESAVWVEVFDADLRLPRIRLGQRERRGRPRPVPGRPAGQPVGLPADQRRQGRLVRDPAAGGQRRGLRQSRPSRSASSVGRGGPHREHDDREARDDRRPRAAGDPEAHPAPGPGQEQGGQEGQEEQQDQA